MATIVCAVDDSPGAAVAVAVAKELAAALDLRLILAHVAHGYRLDSGGESLTGVQGRRGGARLLERLVGEHGLRGGAEQRVEVGDPVEELSRIAREEAAAVMVVGSRTRGLRRRLQSTLAGELAQTAPCPVLVVPPASRR
jgi:nucleotide-binding universal stress UspA family protein